MDPREFHTVARRLLAGGTVGECRSAMSRAYYAVYNVAADWLRRHVRISEGAAGHGEVQRCLANCGNADVIAVASDLGDLHSRRIDADYRMTKAASEDARVAQAAVNEAGEMIRTLDQEFGGPQAVQLRSAIQAYWTTVLRKPL